jgi:acetyl-CoA acyltransferase
MREAVVIDAVRVPFGRAHKEKGVYRDVRSDDLAVHAVKTLLEKTQVPVEEIEDIIWGCVMQEKEQGFCMGRLIGLMAGLPIESGGMTVNRNCASSLQALNQAVHAIMAGAEDVQIAGGSEHMGHIPMDSGFDPNPKIFKRTTLAAFNMGYTAEYVAMKYDISRKRQDEFAARSHHLLAKAYDEGKYEGLVIPTWGRDEAGNRTLVKRDQCLRPETTVDTLKELKPAFIPDVGSLTAGNSSPLTDGASAVLVMSADKAAELGLKPMVKIRATAVAGVDPSIMGLGPVPAVQKACKRAGIDVFDLDVVEINEAFAAQALAVLQLLGIEEEKVNTRGGAIAMGHPLGATGTRVAGGLARLMVDEGHSLGVATMCVGLGMGSATIFERCDN